MDFHITNVYCTSCTHNVYLDGNLHLHRDSKSQCSKNVINYIFSALKDDFPRFVGSLFLPNREQQQILSRI